MMEVKRFDYLDIAKGWGILAVVWAHIMLMGWSHEICYAFHMPLFFMISGMLQRSGGGKFSDFRTFVVKRAKRLFVPYLLYSVVTWAIWMAFKMYRGDEVESYWMPLLQTFIAQGSGAYIVHNSALWFIPCLFAVEIIYFFVGKLKDKAAIFVSFAIAILSFILGQIYGADWWFLLPWNIDAAMIAMPFYCIGHIFVKNFSHEKIVTKTMNNRKAVFTLWIVLSLLLVGLTINLGECSMGSSSYNCSGIIFILRAFVGCMAMILFSLLLSVILKNFHIYQKVMDGIKWLGKNSLDVMCTHIPIKGVIIIIVAALLHVTKDTVSSSLPMSSLVFVITMMVVMPLIVLVNMLFRKRTK